MSVMMDFLILGGLALLLFGVVMGAFRVYDWVREKLGVTDKGYIDGVGTSLFSDEADSSSSDIYHAEHGLTLNTDISAAGGNIYGCDHSSIE